MTYLNEKNYINILEYHFKNNDVVVCIITPSIYCPNCQETKRIIDEFNNEYPDSNIKFYFVDYSKTDILQHYFEFNQLLIYPKFVVFYGNWENKDFFQGVMEFKQLKIIYERTKKVDIN